MAKELFFQNGVERNRGNSGKLWSHLKSLGFSKKVSNSSSIVLEHDGEKKSDSLSVSRIFNSFYTTVAAKLVSKLPNPSGVFNTSASIFRNYYLHKTGLRCNLCLSPVSAHFIRKELNSLKTKKAVGLDDISSLFLRDCIIIIMSRILLICQSQLKRFHHLSRKQRLYLFLKRVLLWIRAITGLLAF